MSQEEKAEGYAVKKISTLNGILEYVISDASDLVKDLRWSVKTYLLFGLVLICFGISEIAYGAEVMQERYYIPLFIGESYFSLVWHKSTTISDLARNTQDCLGFKMSSIKSRRMLEWWHRWEERKGFKMGFD